MSDLFQRFDGFGKCSAFIYISNQDSSYMQISGMSAFVGRCLSIAVISGLQFAIKKLIN